MGSYSILIVDDNEEDRYLLKRYIKLTGLEVRVFECGDGSEAKSFLEAYDANRAQYPEDFPPMLIFLDINMPIMDGWGFLDVFQDLRNAVDIRSSVVVMFTSSDQPGDRERANQFDFVENYIVKGSISTDELKVLLMSSGP